MSISNTKWFMQLFMFETRGVDNLENINALSKTEDNKLLVCHEYVRCNIAYYNKCCCLKNSELLWLFNMFSPGCMSQNLKCCGGNCTIKNYKWIKSNNSEVSFFKIVSPKIVWQLFFSSYNLGLISNYTNKQKPSCSFSCSI